MITIKINENDINNVKSMLSGIKDGAPKALARSLNKTLTGVKTDASTEIRKVLNAKKSTVDATFKTSKATVANLSATFQSTGKPMPLIGFTGTRQTAKGVSVMVKKSEGRKIIPGAFIATVRSAKQRDAGIEGHKGVFWREWHSSNIGKIASAHLKQAYGITMGKPGKIPYGALPKKYRLPMKERFAPRIPDYLGDKGNVMPTVLKKAEDRLHVNIERELNFELSKL